MTAEGYEGTSGPSGQIRGDPPVGFRALIRRSELPRSVSSDLSITSDGGCPPSIGGWPWLWNEADRRDVMADMLHGTTNALV